MQLSKDSNKTGSMDANGMLVNFLVGSVHFNFGNLLKIQFGSEVHSIFALIIFFFICGLNPRDRGDFLLVWILLPEGRKSDKIFDQTQKPNKGPSIRSDEHHIGDTGGYKEIKKKKKTQQRNGKNQNGKSLGHIFGIHRSSGCSGFSMDSRPVCLSRWK